MALTFLQFREALKADQARLGQREKVDGLLTCAECQVPLQESVTGSRPVSDGSYFCSDCYFEAIGKEFDDHPVILPRATRRA